MQVRSALVSSLAVAVAMVACQGGRDPTLPMASTEDAGSGASIGTGAPMGTGVPIGTGAPLSSAASASAPAGTCKPSSVISTPSCAPRVHPPSNASSANGCKSDAECKNGIDGRCVDNRDHRRYGALPPAARNLLAGPPPLPPDSVCVYDQCRTNADCGAKARCQCGAGDDRNGCMPLDACLRDADCGADGLCACGASGSPNGCMPGNCRADADCGGQKCGSGPTGSFCRTPRDKCRTNEDCKGGPFAVCDYDRGTKAWACRVIPPRPPG